MTGPRTSMLGGEKRMNIRRIGFLTLGDNRGYAMNMNQNVMRKNYYNPLPDTQVTDNGRFGSSHPAGFNIVMCDTSVKFLSYQVSLEVFARMGHRGDGVPYEWP